MPFPYLLYMLWGLWPLAAYPGGKLFAPLVFLLGLFALPLLKRNVIGGTAFLAVLFLTWVCASASWSPAAEGIFSGTFLGEDFAVEASYLRIGLTFIGCFLFLWLILHKPVETYKRFPLWIYIGLGTHLLVVVFIAIFRDQLLGAEGRGLILTGQSIGRNINLLALGAPLLLAGLAGWKSRLLALPLACLLIVIVTVLALRLDGLAAVFGLILGAISLAVVQFAKKGGFRLLFNTLGAAVLFAPAIVFGLAQFAPALRAYVPLTTHQRILIWQAALERIVEKPLFGHGVNASPTWTATYGSRPEFLEQLVPELAEHRIIPNHPHNMALQIWAETGLVGALLVCALIIMLGRLIPDPRDLALGPRIAAAGLFGASLAYFSVSYSVWDESFWASTAIVASGIIALQKLQAS